MPRRKGDKLSDETKAKISAGVRKRLENDPTIRQKLSETGLRRYQNLDERRKTSEQLARIENDPILKAKRVAAIRAPESKHKMSESAKRYRNRPDVKARMSVVASEANKRKWANPEFRAMMQENRSPILSEKAKAQWRDDEFRNMMVNKARERFNRMWADPELHSQMARKVAQNGSAFNFQSGVHISPKAGEVAYRSSWELEVYKQLDASSDVIIYQVEPFTIPYTMDGKTRHYLPDLLVHLVDDDWLVVEIKPDSLVDDPQNQAKFLAAQAIYGDRFEVWSEETIFQQ